MNVDREAAAREIARASRRNVIVTIVALALGTACQLWNSPRPPGWCPEGTQRVSGGECEPFTQFGARHGAVDAGVHDAS